MWVTHFIGCHFHSVMWAMCVHAYVLWLVRTCFDWYAETWSMIHVHRPCLQMSGLYISDILAGVLCGLGDDLLDYFCDSLCLMYLSLYTNTYVRVQILFVSAVSAPNQSYRVRLRCFWHGFESKHRLIEPILERIDQSPVCVTTASCMKAYALLTCMHQTLHASLQQCISPQNHHEKPQHYHTLRPLLLLAKTHLSTDWNHRQQRKDWFAPLHNKCTRPTRSYITVNIHNTLLCQLVLHQETMQNCAKKLVDFRIISRLLWQLKCGYSCHWKAVMSTLTLMFITRQVESWT